MWRISLVVAVGVALLIVIVAGSTYLRASDERIALTSDLQYRTRVLADSLQESIGPSFQRHATTTVQRIVTKIADNERIAAVAVFDSAGNVIAKSDILPVSFASSTLVSTAMDSSQESGEIAHDFGSSMYVFVEPLTDDQDSVIGALMVAQNASYIDESIWNIWQSNMIRSFFLLIVVVAMIGILVRWVFYQPLMRLSESLGAIRRGDVPGDFIHADGVFAPLAGEISKMSASLRQARLSASEEARMRLEKIDSPWTAERLKEFIKAYAKNRPIYVLSNSEPYMHYKIKNKIEWSVPAGGVVTALNPVMEATGGTWIAHGRGDADKEMTDTEGKIRVPPEEPSYTLKRIWLTEQELRGYYDGFSNEALWPLCLMAHVRPVFRGEDWNEYRKVNGLFAKALLEEIKGVERPIVLVQDYHLALVPAMLKKSRPDAQVAIFWHIPWPSAAQFSICPWRKDILQGLLGADLVGFHTQQHCNNFMDTVASELEARIDFEHFSIIHHGHATSIKAFPISIAFSGNGVSAARPTREVLEHLGIRTDKLVLGVDRLDYTKGILERFKGLEFLFAEHPEYRGTVTMLQIASPTRESIVKYREYAAQVEAEADRINERFGTRDWKPIVFERRNYSHAELAPLYRLADACVITSLHDGMNLVAKEYAAARDDEAGVLILSHFTGASRDLKGAIIVNPYSAEETSVALHRALIMPKTEQRRRMKAMRNSVRDYNVYRWSAEIIKALIRLD